MERPIESQGEKIRQISDGNGIGLAVEIQGNWYVFTSPVGINLNRSKIDREYPDGVARDMISFLRGE